MATRMGANRPTMELKVLRHARLNGFVGIYRNTDKPDQRHDSRAFSLNAAKTTSHTIIFAYQP